MSGAKRRDIKKKWKARTFLERGSESSGDNVKETSETSEKETGAERSKGAQESDDGAGGRRRSGRGEQDRGAGGGMRGGSREHTLWPGALFDSHCHLNLVLRYQL